MVEEGRNPVIIILNFNTRIVNKIEGINGGMESFGETIRNNNGK